MNENIFNIGFAMFVALVILWSGSITIIDTNSMYAKFWKFMFGRFSFIWLLTTSYLIWISLALPKPKGNNLF